MVASDPTPDAPDFDALWRRSEQNRKRSRRGLVLGIVALVLVVALGVASLLVYLDQRHVPELASETREIAERTQVVVNRLDVALERLQQADDDRACVSAATGFALAALIEQLAAGFETPPAPDEGRLMAVAEMRALAAGFRSGSFAESCSSP